tara:strand:+ start:368 stop:469 length:102 start_codon:yes stop_codon:yes gene_type:complete
MDDEKLYEKILTKVSYLGLIGYGIWAIWFMLDL